MNYLPALTLNCNPLDLCLLSSQDYRWTTSAWQGTFLLFQVTSKLLIMKGCWILSKAKSFAHLCWDDFCPYFCLYAVLHLLICIYWTIHASLEWNWLDRDIQYFWYTIEFSLPVFYWEFLLLCSWKRLVYNSLFCCILVQFSNENNTRSLEWFYGQV
jgi:hypothetical protein